MATTPYERLGGEQGVRRLVDRFYDLMDTLPEAKIIRDLHPKELTGSRDKLFKFLSGWLGGPPLYMQEYGHPRLRARHLPFAIGSAERDAWLLCMERALNFAIQRILCAIRKKINKVGTFKQVDSITDDGLIRGGGVP